jgi:putative transposase
MGERLMVLTPAGTWEPPAMTGRRSRPGHAPGSPSPSGRMRLTGQYTSIRFTEHLALQGIWPSIGLYKTERIRTTVFHHGPYKTIAEVEYATAGWVDWYNQRRLHGSLGMIPPVE